MLFANQTLFHIWPIGPRAISLARGLHKYNIAQKKVLYSVYYTESIYFFIFQYLYISKLYTKVQGYAFTEIRRYKGTGEERKMFVKILFEYKLYNTPNKKHKFYKE